MWTQYLQGFFSLSLLLIASPFSSFLPFFLSSSEKKFVGERRGSTSEGTEYQVRLDEESFLGPGKFFKTTNSNVMKMSLDGDEVRYEFHRTRHQDEKPVRSGQFQI